MKKVFKLVLVMVAMLLVITGCGQGEKSDSASKSEDKKDKKLVVYTNSASDGRGDWLKEKAKEKGFNIELVELGGGDLYNRLLAEKGNPIADVTYGLSQMDWASLEKEDTLQEFKPKWSSKVDSKLLNKTNKYSPLVEQRILMVYNEDKIKKADAPSDWADLYETDKYKGKYHVPSNLGGGTDKQVAINILTRFLDKSGELGVSKEGWKAVEKYYKNGYQTPEGEDRNTNLAEGKTPVSYWFSSGMPNLEKQYKVKLGLVKPKIGVPSVVEQIGIMKKKDGHDYKNAEEFVEWFGSAEVQGEWAKKFGSIPANKDAIKDTQPMIKEIYESTKPMEIDYSIVQKYIDKWVEKIELEIMQ
ncbi:extracellular solute-binding protein [Macrococcus capreoli]|uniref:extracellular solute-binding protein n=1 Tax=Macrococcus capreoli TaxID=2982690 RepID=UPI0021D5D2B4|nr:extracellular solute-binding protein [Macrococcus sp. TMW 2.2395]MCU7557415.1 extracellular solute-binding protein [Macrococcus sp. TMW 2.2395]